MKNFTVLFCLSFFYLSLRATPPEYDHVFDDGIITDEAEFIETYDQKFVVVGNISNDVDMDPGPGSHILSTQAFSVPYVASYNEDGTFRWAFKFAAETVTDNIYITDMIINSLGEIMVLGVNYGSLDLDPGSGEAKIVNSSGETNFLAFYDMDKNYLRHYVLHDDGFDRVDHLGLTSIPSGGYALSGAIGSGNATVSLDLKDHTANILTVTYPEYKYFVARYSNTDELLWVKSGDCADDYNSIHLRKVTGDYFALSTKDKDDQHMLLKLDLTNGSVEDSVSFPYFYFSYYFGAISIDEAGSFYLLVHAEEGFDIDLTGSSPEILPNNSTGDYIVKYDSQKAIIWKHFILGNGGFSMDANEDYVYLYGETKHFGPNGNNVDDYLTSIDSDPNSFIAKFSATTGEHIGNKVLDQDNTYDNDKVYDIHLNGSDGVYYAASSGNNMWFGYSKVNYSTNGVGIFESGNKQYSHLNIFPNPSSKYIGVETDFDWNSYKILSPLGEIISEKEKDEEISIDFLTEGMYILQLVDKDNHAANLPFVKE